MGVPAVSASSSINTDHTYTDALTSTPEQIFVGRGNLYGFYIEETSGTDIYVQFYDAADIADVTVGSTAPDFTFRIPANAGMGKDCNDSPLHFFAKGCVAAVTTTRTGGVAPAFDATAHFWSYNQKY